MEDIKMIENICNVFIFVSDQNKAKEFWTKKVGFEVRTESKMGKDNLWIEVVPKNGNTTITLYPKSLRADAQPSKSVITFFTNDIQKTYDELSSKGVVFTSEPKNLGYGIFAEFCDEDGNTFSLKQV